MNFNFVHPILLIFINGVYALFLAILTTKERSLKDQSLERIFIGIVISILWLIIGIYFKVNIFILVFEAMAVGLAFIGLILKLNMPGEHKFFGRAVPGHGASESKTLIFIKKILFYVFMAAFILFIIGAIIFFG